jgi:thiol-disulfide isomerase/thioredoxin
MSKRNTYLLGALAVAAGVALLVAAIVGLSSDDGGDSVGQNERTAPEVPITEGSEPPAGDTNGGQSGGQDSSGTNAQGAAIQRELARGELVRAPDFTLDVIHEGTLPARLREPFQRARSGNALQLSKLRGTPVVLHMSSSRCPPCRADSRLVESTWKRWGPRGVLFLGISVNDSSAEAVIRQYRLTYPFVADGDSEVAGRYGATSLPHTVFITAGGDIVGEVAGSPSVRQLELGTAATRSGEAFGAEQGSSRVPLP